MICGSFPVATSVSFSGPPPRLALAGIVDARFVPAAALDTVGSAADGDHVVPAAAADRVVAIPAHERVIAAPAADRVIVRARIDQPRRAAADHDEIPARRPH